MEGIIDFETNSVQTRWSLHCENRDSKNECMITKRKQLSIGLGRVIVLGVDGHYRLSQGNEATGIVCQ